MSSGQDHGRRGDEPGLRERKRLAAMERIQQVALDLFDAHGYAQVTIERIAAAAEVSPSSVYRYFGTKENIVLWDEYDPSFLARLREHADELPLIAAVRQVIHDLIAEASERDEALVTRRVTYMMREPSIEAASALHAHTMAEEIAPLIAARLGRETSDLDVQVYSHALIGGLVGGIHHWHDSGFVRPFGAIVDEVLTLFERGFGSA